MFQWHLVARFAPENLLFRDAVIDYQESVRKNDMGEARNRLKNIVETFMDSASAFEVSHRGVKIDPASAELSADVFEPVMDHVDRDLARALQTLWPTPVFQSYLKNRATLEAIGSSPDLKKKRSSSSANGADPLLMVRSAYGVREKLLMRRFFETGSPYLYTIHSSETDAKLGYCRQVEGVFVFFDADEKQLLETPAAELLGRSSLGKPAPPAGSTEMDFEPSGCFGGKARKGSNLTADEPTAQPWYVKIHAGKEYGPFAYTDVALWWRFHLIALSCSVRPEKGAYEKIESSPYFTPSAQVQLIDPTALGELGNAVNF